MSIRKVVSVRRPVDWLKMTSRLVFEYMYVIYMCARSLCISAQKRSTAQNETGRPVSDSMHNECAHIYITYIYSNISLLVIFNQSTGLWTESNFSNRHHYSSMVVFFSLHQKSSLFVASLHQWLPLSILYKTNMKSPF